MTARGDASLLRVEELRTWFPIRAGLLRRSVGWVRAVDGVDLELQAGRTPVLFACLVAGWWAGAPVGW